MPADEPLFRPDPNVVIPAVGATGSDPTSAPQVPHTHGPPAVQSPPPGAAGVPEDHELRRYFAGLVEHAFGVKLGWADPVVQDYLSGLLARFVHVDALHGLRNAGGRPLTEVAEMLVSAFVPEAPTPARRRVVIHRHVGDYTLFWTGVYPESLGRLRGPGSRDCVVDYIAQGKRSYRLAAEAERAEEPTESRVLGDLSDNFEECVYGLTLVRRGMEHRPRGQSAA